ncbi:unnamed protein product [Sphagnum jensenii]
MKQYRQGLRSDQVSYRFTNRSHGIEFKRGKYMAEMLENRYPSFEQCCKLLKEDEAEVIAFDRNFALAIDKIHEDYILEYKGEENGDTRIGNNFCLRTRDAEGQITELVSSIKSSGHFVFLNNSNRYSATNFASLIKFGTIEFRSLECTTDIDRVVHWIKTVQALKVAAREYENPREIIAQFSRMGIHKFIRHNLQDCAYKYLNLPGYSQMMRDGMRLAQDFAYCSDWIATTSSNGFIYARNNVFPEILRDEIAIAATTALGLDFGAVDIIEDKNEKLYVLEVNTAPGLEGKTVELYAEAFRSACQG